MRKPGVRTAQRAIVVGAIAVGGIAAGVIGSGGGSSSNMANAWVNTTAGGSPSVCSSPCAYDSTHAYGSFINAYNAIKTGLGCGAHTIYVKSGSYAAQSMNMATSGNLSCSAKCHLSPGYPATTGSWPDGTSQSQDLTGCNTIQPEPGGFAVSIASLQLEVPYVYIKDMTITANQCGAAADHCTGGLTIGGSSAVSRSGSFTCTNSATGEQIVDNLDGAATFAIQGANDQTALINSSVFDGWESRSGLGISSPIRDCINGNGNPADGRNQHMLLYGLRNYDELVYPPASHNECIHFYGSDNWVIANSFFANCAGNTIAFQPNFTDFHPQINHGLIVNTVFGDCDDSSPPNMPAGAPCGAIEGGGITLRCGQVTDTQNIEFLHDSSNRTINFTTSASPNLCNSAGDSWPKSMGFVFIGNTFPSLSSATGFPTGYSGGYNLWPSSWAGGMFGTDVKDSSHTITQLFTSPAGRTWDFTLSSAFSNPGVDMVACSFGPSPTYDTTGTTTRPQGAGCDAGAYER